MGHILMANVIKNNHFFHGWRLDQHNVITFTSRRKNLGSRVASPPRKFLRPESFCAFAVELSAFFLGYPGSILYVWIVRKLSRRFQTVWIFPHGLKYFRMIFESVRMFPASLKTIRISSR